MNEGDPREMHPPALGEDADVTRHLSQREMRCRIEGRALDLWLRPLTLLRWVMVGLGTILAAFAGATALGRYGDPWESIGGICALTASILTGLHTALDCEAHQAECRRLIRVYASLEAAYQAALVLPLAQRPNRQEALEARFEEALTKANASAPRRYRDLAEAQELRRRS
jgi:hypothetical protein